jgi:hypothetical protein
VRCGETWFGQAGWAWLGLARSGTAGMAWSGEVRCGSVRQRR